MAAFLVAVPASAQHKSVEANIGAGYTFSLSEVRDHLGDGYNVDLGLTFNVSWLVGIQLEYGFNDLGEKRVNLPVSPLPSAPGGVQEAFYANMDMHHVTLNLVVPAEADAKARPYVMAGGGVYHRTVEVTSPGVGYVPGYCDPFWFYCSPGGWVPVDNILGSRSSTDFGVDFGGGISVMVTDAVSVYVEARYHYIWGPEVTDPTTNEKLKANGQFFPITVGVRF
jgi:opacity protein-like surface antigen